VTSQSWLADVAHAATALGATTADDWQRIAGLLGLGERRTVARPGQGRVEGTPLTGAPVGAPAPGAAKASGREEVTPTATGQVPSSGTPGTGTRLHPVEHRPVRQTGWSVDTLPAPRSQATPDAVPHLPLLAPGSAKAVLYTALARIAPEGEPDLETAVERLAEAGPLSGIPRRPLPTLRHGVQVLADMSTSMEPFARDVAGVVTQVRALAGPAGTQVLRFADCPLRGAGPGPRGTWEWYRPPAAGTTVLILSGLGAVGPWFDPHRATPEEWQRTVRLISGRTDAPSWRWRRFRSRTGHGGGGPCWMSWSGTGGPRWAGSRGSCDEPPVFRRP
jgi:hypothetical protein